MKNKKGFTLIELLAIIVILAIIAVITVPIILNIIENSKKGAAINSAYGYKDSIDKFYYGKMIQDKDFSFLGGSYYVNGENGYLEGNGEILNLSFSGRIPSNGVVVLSQSGRIESAKLCIDDYAVVYSDGEEISATKGCNTISQFYLEPGLYDEYDNLVALYDDLVSEHDFDPSEGSVADILSLDEYSSGVKLILPNTVTSIADNAFSETNLTSVRISSSVVSIGESAFSDCENLTSVTFEAGSRLESIGYGAFVETNITSITIPSSVTSIGSYAFEGVKALFYSGTAEDEDNNNWGALSLNPYIENDLVYTDNTKTSLLGYIGNSSSIVIPSGVTNIGNYAFEDTDIISVTIPSSVTSIDAGAFRYCSNLMNVTFESGSHLTSIGEDAFR